MQPSPVKELALSAGILVFQPTGLKTETDLQHICELSPDLMVVVAYGMILPVTILDLFPSGCINIHASLLPRWRGAAPIQRAILAGDRETGISIMRMEQGLDTGPVYLARTIPVLPIDDAGSLHDRLAALGATCIVEALPQIAAGTLVPVPQQSDGITYAHKVTKPEAAIDWQRDSVEVDRQIRAFNPYPGAFSKLRSESVKIWHGVAIAGTRGMPGEILSCGPHGIDVACGNGALKVTELQKAGGKRLPAADFLRGLSLEPGECFAS